MINRVIDLAKRAKEIYMKRSPEEKRLLLSHIFSNSMLKDQKVAYTLTKNVECITQRVQEKLDSEKVLEPNKCGPTKGQKDSFESICSAMFSLQDNFQTIFKIWLCVIYARPRLY